MDGPGLHSRLVVAALVPTVVCAVAVALVTTHLLPTAEAFDDAGVRSTNTVAGIVFAAVVFPLAGLLGFLWTTLPAGERDELAELELLQRIPFRMTAVHGTVWFAAAAVFGTLNRPTPVLGSSLGIGLSLGGVLTGAFSYLLCARVLRPVVAAGFARHPPLRRRGPGLRLRAILSWLVGTGVPLVMLVVAAAYASTTEAGRTQALVLVLVLGLGTAVSGVVFAALAGAATAEPIDDMRAKMRRVEGGDLEVVSPAFDASEIGLLQAGFTRMVAGLAERERLRDLFGRHVGHHVARLALQDEVGPGPAVGERAVRREAAVVFVDLIGSTRMAATVDPDDFLAAINEFSAAVVEVVERNDGWVNKFIGDAVLAVFGAPTQTPGWADDALRASRELHALLNAGAAPRVGIGVSAGTVLAGNVGEERRYEFTVIGDPVNEAARLSESAKRRSGVLASGSALQRADDEEAARWQITGSEVLRGRLDPTDLAVPLV